VAVANVDAKDSGSSASQVSPVPPKSETSPVANVATPTQAAIVPEVSSDAMQPPTVGSETVGPPIDSVLVKSAAQHLFLQPRKFRLKHFLRLVALVGSAILVAGVGYLKYQSIRRGRIESAVTEQLKTSPTLRRVALRVFVSDTREVTLDGKVPSKEDFIAAGNLAASVPGVTHVMNRVEYTPITPAQVLGESYESLIVDGTKLMDDGRYDEAIDCFFKAAALDPKAQTLLEQAQRAQKTEEQLLRNRQ
jgi:hypothetical protein